MNKEKYESLLKELNSLDGVDAFVLNVRERLIKNLELNKGSRENVTSVLVAFYEYMQKKENFKVLTDYCRKVFSSYYPLSIIENNYDFIIKDELLLDKLITIGNDELVQNLVDVSYKNISEYDKIVEKCEKANRKIEKPMLSNSGQELFKQFNNVSIDEVTPLSYTADNNLKENFDKKVNDAEQKVAQVIENSNGITNSDSEESIEKRAELAKQKISQKVEAAKNIVDIKTPSNDNSISQSDLDYFSSKPINSQERNQRYDDIVKTREEYHKVHNLEIQDALAKKTEDLNNDGISISQKSLEKTLNKKNVDITKYDIDVSEKFTLLNSSKIGQKITNLMFKYSDSYVAQVMGDDKKKFVVSPNNTFMRIAACNQAKLEIIKKAKEKKQKITDKILKVSSNAKNILIKMAHKTKDKALDVKKKVNDKINENREHLADSLLNVANKVAPNETYVKKLSKEEIDEIINSIETRKTLGTGATQVASDASEIMLALSEEEHKKTA